MYWMLLIVFGALLLLTDAGIRADVPGGATGPILICVGVTALIWLLTKFF